MATGTSLLNIFIAATCLKLLLFVAYHSTDFDVHRNWLAITNTLPLDQWYVEDTSQWTLDYPPFFAWFEYVIALFVPREVADDGCLDIVEVGEYGWPTIAFQRLSVIISEIVLFLSLQYYVNVNAKQSHKKGVQAFAIAGSIALSPGFLIIDHIHFQYNGMMYGILIFSIVAAMQNRLLLSGALFAILLCFKHIYLYLAPAYFAYLLRLYVFAGNSKKITGIDFVRTFKLGLVIIGVFVLAFGPFVYLGQIPQVLSRLFPFSRGLTHAYWAPNVWAIYSFADRALIILYKLQNSASASVTRGLVGDVKFTVLPDIEPQLTFFLTLFYQVLALIPLFMWPTVDRFLAALTLCGYASFLFGWHVHEKAILLVIIPFSFLALKDKRILTSFVPLVVAGYISLFPLIFTPGEELLKVAYTFVWFVMFIYSFNNLVNVSYSPQRRIFLLDRLSLVYMVGFVPLMFSHYVIAQILPKYEFLKLMIVSVYCSLGIVASWCGFSWLYFFDEELWAEPKLEAESKSESVSSKAQLD